MALHARVAFMPKCLLQAILALVQIMLFVACLPAQKTMPLTESTRPALAPNSSTATVPVRATTTETPQVAEGQPPPPGRVLPNTSRITATVLKYTMWPPGSLRDNLPLVPAGQTLYSFTVKIHTSNSEDPTQEILPVPGSVYEAFSADVLTPELVGKKIEATLKLTGSTEGVRWIISNIHILP